VTIITPYDIKEGLFQKIIRRLTQLLRRRASIEPIIGHIKSDHRMGRKLLKGILGDTINPLFAAAAFNLLKYARIEYARLHKPPKSLIHHMPQRRMKFTGLPLWKVDNPLFK
jgi:hypothetical protein